MSAFPDGRLTELLTLDCAGYIVAVTPERYPYGTLVTPQVRYQLREIAFPFAVQLPAGTDEHPDNEPSRTGGNSEQHMFTVSDPISRCWRQAEGAMFWFSRNKLVGS